MYTSGCNPYMPTRQSHHGHIQHNEKRSARDRLLIWWATQRWHIAWVSARAYDEYLARNASSGDDAYRAYTGWRTKKRGHRPSYLIANIPKTPWPNCMEIGGLLQYYMLNTVINFLFNTATVVYSRCTNIFEHHTVAVFSLGGATERWNF